MVMIFFFSFASVSVTLPIPNKLPKAMVETTAKGKIFFLNNFKPSSKIFKNNCIGEMLSLV